MEHIQIYCWCYLAVQSETARSNEVQQRRRHRAVEHFLYSVLPWCMWCTSDACRHLILVQIHLLISKNTSQCLSPPLAGSFWFLFCLLGFCSPIFPAHFYFLINHQSPRGATSACSLRWIKVQRAIKRVQPFMRGQYEVSECLDVHREFNTWVLLSPFYICVL